MFAKRIDLETQYFAIWAGHCLRLQVDGQLVARVGFDLLEQFIDFFIAEDDRQQAVLEAVVEENVGVARRDDTAETVLFEGPWRMLTARTATEVLAGQQHAGALVTVVVQDEVRVLRALAVVLIRLTDIQVTPLIEQVGAKAGALDRLEELLGNDLVGVDVGAIQRRNQAGVLGKGFHAALPWINSRTSTKRPVTAAAAAMAGLTRWVRPPAP
ncbi:hypothetical protein D3C80_1335710 [compost metagenome]